MYSFKKYAEGIAIQNDDTGASRLLTEEETVRVLDIIPTLQEKKTAAHHRDSLPEELKDLRI